MSGTVTDLNVKARRGSITLLGRYDAGDLHRAMRVAIGRWHLRRLRASRDAAPVNCDIRADGKVVPL